MDKVNGYPLYWLGTSLGALAAKLSPGVTYQELASQCQWSAGALRSFRENDALELKGSKATAASLSDFLNRISEPNFLQTNGSVAVMAAELSNLHNWLSHFASVMSSELALANSYVADPVRGWDMSVMTDSAERTLSQTARSALSPDEIQDVREAGKCLAFGVPTAAAFHLYRTLESVVLKYMPIYGVTLGTSDRNLGNYIKLLEKNNTDKKITTILTHIKDQYRNPAIHPGTFYDLDGAANQFALIQSVIHMMVEDLASRSQAKGESPLLSIGEEAQAPT